MRIAEPRIGRTDASVLLAGGEMEEDVVWIVLLPRARAGATQVRASRLEHTLRVQRV